MIFILLNFFWVPSRSEWDLLVFANIKGICQSNWKEKFKQTDGRVSSSFGQGMTRMFKI